MNGSQRLVHLRRLRTQEARRTAMPPPEELDEMMRKHRAAQLIARRIVNGVTDEALVAKFHGKGFMAKLSRRKGKRALQICDAARAIERTLLSGEHRLTAYQRYARAAGIRFVVQLSTQPPRPSVILRAKHIREQQRYLSDECLSYRNRRPRRRLAA